jgi:uroporphyrinogen III methyltransferase/synthase
MVYLVGAGPGNAELLTLRAVECLGRADLVLYDRLVAARLLDFAPAGAAKVCVAELAGNHPERAPLIIERMIEAARQGQCVVRLKGGDPLIFGRGGEEAEALHQAGIPFEIVPGVTAALGAAACAGIPLTHRRHASAVALVTGHEDPDKPDSLLDWEALARFPGTLVFYMGIARLESLAQSLIQHGKPPETPAALVQWATLGQQRTVVSTLAELARAGRAAGITAPALTIVGPVVALHQQVEWFEKRPLFGRRIVVTRPAHQAAAFVRRLEELGAVVFTLPTVAIRPLTDWSAVDDALRRLSEYQWLVFTSVNGVQALLGRLCQTGRDLRALGHLRLAAIGPATADALRAFHLEPDVVPGEYRAEGLAAALKERAVGQRVLYARADRGREVLREELSTVARVDQLAVYSQVDEAGGAAVDLLRKDAVDYITLTSSNIARALARMLDREAQEAILRGSVRLVTISPVTSAAVRELGWPVAAEASVYTTAGLIDALLACAKSRPVLDESKRIR